MVQAPAESFAAGSSVDHVYRRDQATMAHCFCLRDYSVCAATLPLKGVRYIVCSILGLIIPVA